MVEELEDVKSSELEKGRNRRGKDEIGKEDQGESKARK